MGKDILRALLLSLLLPLICSGQLFPDSNLSFSSFATGDRPSLAACGLRWL